ncbi:hypothetical protein GCM10028787_07590 [Brachybacterium horti]
MRAYLSTGAEVTVLIPATVANAETLRLHAAAAPTLLLGRPRDHRGAHRTLLTAVHRMQPLLPARGLADAPWHFIGDLLLDRSVHALLRSADVVDLQWEEYGHLAPLIRRLAPAASLTCMFHDVNDQKLGRAVDAAASPEERHRADERRRINLRRLGRSQRALDRGFVLSDKDRRLLSKIAPALRLTVVPPPLVDASTPLTDVSARPPVAGFVGALRRHENRDAAIRLATRIWPTVHKARPDAALRIIGGGLEDEPRTRLTGIPGVELTGFIEDLEEAYAGLRLTVSPLDRGAGVKFKVVESIVRGIPTLTTPVGAEGIDQGLFALVSDDDEILAHGVLAAMNDDAVAAAAHAAAVRARRTYGLDVFEMHYLDAIETTLDVARRSR